MILCGWASGDRVGMHGARVCVCALIAKNQCKEERDLVSTVGCTVRAGGAGGVALCVVRRAVRCAICAVPSALCGERAGRGGEARSGEGGGIGRWRSKCPVKVCV